jgi:dipeptidyl aminopeptidase/acylaminoacyl peptidase
MPEGAWINALAWSPDGRTLAYLVQTRCSDRYPCPSALWRVDPTTGQAARLLSLEDPPGIDVTWSDPQRMLLMGGDFRTFYSVDAATGKLLGALTPTPPATAAAPAAAPAAATAAATATPVAPATPVASASADR